MGGWKDKQVGPQHGPLMTMVHELKNLTSSALAPEDYGGKLTCLG